jgi:hypothetical protein
MEEVRSFLAKNPRYASPLHHAPHRVAGSAANLVHEVAPLIKLSVSERAAAKAKSAAGAVMAFVASAPDMARKVAAVAMDPEIHAHLREDAILIRDVISGKAKERFRPLVEKLAGKAVFENNPEVMHVTHASHGEAIAAE